MKKLLLTSAFAAIAFMSVGARHRATTPPPLNIDFRRSLVLTDINDFVGITAFRLELLTDPSAALTSKGKSKIAFAYGDNYLIDTTAAIIVDVEASPARWTAEVAATRTMIDRTDGFGMR